MKKIREFIEYFLLSIKWTSAHFIKKVMIVSLSIFLIPLVLLSAAFELLGELCRAVHNLLEGLFNLIYDLGKPFAIALFKTMGFTYGRIYLGTEYSRMSVLQLKELAKNNNIKCYILDDMYRYEDSYYVNVIISKDTDLNLLRLIFNTNQQKTKF